MPEFEKKIRVQKKYCDLTEEQKEARRAYSREFYKRNSAKITAENIARKARLGHTWKSCQKEKQSEYWKRSYAKSRLIPERVARMAQYNKKSSKGQYVKAKIEIVAAYGGKCACCDETRIQFLTIDHVNNDGRIRRAQGEAKGRSFYRWLIKQGCPDYVQLLCWNCNLAKHLYGKCPHLTEREMQAISA